MTSETTKLQKLGKNIKAKREQKNLSQNALANMLGISREHLAKIETAKRGISIKLIFKLSEILEVKEAEFFKF